MNASDPNAAQASDIVTFTNVSRRFAGMVAVNNISFSIRKGEFFSLLGPSGCGKTTTLRLLAGFEQPDDGQVRIAGQVVNGQRPYQRGLGMVFQSYALFPHLSVEGNVAFGLEQRKVPRSEIPARVRQAMEMVRLDPATFGKRKPAQLSGGQKQRVALARALVMKPPILLLDEPLGALDLKLRKEMQLELKHLNRQLGITFVYVTHDQEEALTMSDRIAVMDNARVAQLGSPSDIYESPRTPFVARFIGESSFLTGTVQGRQGDLWEIKRAAGDSFYLPDSPGLAAGRAVQVALRPEWLTLASPDAMSAAAPPPSGHVSLEKAAPDRMNRVRGTIKEVIYLGDHLQVLVEVAGGDVLKVAMRNEGQRRGGSAWKSGDATAVAFLPEDTQLLEDA